MSKHGVVDLTESPGKGTGTGASLSASVEVPRPLKRQRREAESGGREGGAWSMSTQKVWLNQSAEQPCGKTSVATAVLFTDRKFLAAPSSIDGRNGARSSSKAFAKPPKCLCKIEARAKRVNKEGPTQGRYFYGCTKPSKSRCKFFQWAKGEPHTKEALSSQWLRFCSPQFCLSSKMQGVGAAGAGRRQMLTFSPSDIIQGGVGDCWFISAAAVVAERQDLISRIFSKHLYQGTIPTNGKLDVQLCIDGKWTSVVVDTFLPVKTIESKTAAKQRSALEQFGMQFAATYAKPGAGNSLWVAYLEKAYAKACGSYQAISGGEIVEAMGVLCGCPTEVICLNGPTFDSEVVWARMLSFLSSGFPMGCGTASSGEGVVGGHAYSILDVREVAGVKPSRQRTMKEFFGGSSSSSAGAKPPLSEHLSHEGTLRVMKIRNPWGKKEWKGAFGAKSEVWTQELRDLLGQSDKNDGQFWMTYQDFQRRFVNIDVAKIHKDWFEADYEIDDSGSNETGVLSKQVVQLRVFEPTWVQLCLFLPLKRGKVGDYSDGTILVMKRRAAMHQPIELVQHRFNSYCRCDQIEFVADDTSATYEVCFMNFGGHPTPSGQVLPNHVFRIFSAKPVFTKARQLSVLQLQEYIACVRGFFHRTIVSRQSRPGLVGLTEEKHFQRILNEEVCVNLWYCRGIFVIAVTNLGTSERCISFPTIDGVKGITKVHPNATMGDDGRYRLGLKPFGKSLVVCGAATEEYSIEKGGILFLYLHQGFRAVAAKPAPGGAATNYVHILDTMESICNNPYMSKKLETVGLFQFVGLF